MNVLVVDDHKLIANDEVRELSQLLPDAEFTAMYDSLEALETAQKQHFDLALLDIDMPVMDGLTLARRLQELYPNINIIFATGYPEYALQAYDTYASAFLVKPVGKAALKNALEHLRHPIMDEKKITDFYQGSSSIGEKIKAQRVARNMTVKDIADKMCVSPQAVYRWESGERMPDIVTFLSLVRMFGINVEQMLK